MTRPQPVGDGGDEGAGRAGHGRGQVRGSMSSIAEIPTVRILLVGPKGSGKSVLLKRIRDYITAKTINPSDPFPSTEPTQGVSQNVFKVKNMTLIVDELGGEEIGRWKEQLEGIRGLVYVFDGGDLVQTATNVVWLTEIIRASELIHLPVLIALTKVDVPGGVTFPVIDRFIDFHAVPEPSRLSFAATSMIAGVGIPDVLQWLAKVIA